VFATSDNPGGNPTMGGPIMGVGIPVKKASLLEYKKQKHYNEWEFDYYPIEDQMAAGLAGGTVNGTSDNPGTGTANTGSGTGSFGSSSFGSSSFGSSNSGFGSNSGSSSGFGSNPSSGTGTNGNTGSPTSPNSSNPNQQQ
jgi:hypothetical protein